MKEEMQKENVRVLREWSLLQPHHPKVVDDEIYLSFVNGSKTMERAKKKLESFFTWRAYLSKSSLFYNIRDPADSYFLRCSKAVKCFLLPKISPEGNRVIFGCISDDFDEYFDSEQTTTYINLSSELVMKLWPDTKGVFTVWDMNGITPKRAAKANLNTLQISCRYFQDSYPHKMKGFVFWNTPPIVETIYNTILKSFITDKLKKRIVLTSENVSCLKKYLPEESLPMDFGGKEKHSSDLHDEWCATLLKHKDWLKSASLLLADETKRPPDSKPPIFGIDGTFRTIAID